MKIGVMFGNPETTTGGNALKFYASQRLDIRRIGAIKDGEQVIGNRTRVKVVKNKVAPPFKEVEFDIMYGQGISREGDVLDLAAQENIVEKSGTWFSFGGERIGQGREQAKAFLREHPEILQQVEGRLFEKFGIRRGPVAVPAPEEAEAEKKGRVRPRSRLGFHAAAARPRDTRAGLREEPARPFAGGRQLPRPDMDRPVPR